MELESGGEGLQGALGDGAGKRRLVVQSAQPIVAMSLLSDPMGYLTNLSTAPGREPQGPPDLVVVSPSVSNRRPVAGATFTLSATVQNDGDTPSPVTVLRYYRSTNATMTTTDRAVGTDAVAGLAASGSASASVVLTAPSTPATYYYGACVEAVAEEFDTANNCSTSVEVNVRESTARAAGATGPGGSVAEGERQRTGRGDDVHPVGHGEQCRRRRLAVGDDALLPLAGRDHHDDRHAGGGHRCGGGACRVGERAASR